MNTPAPFTLAFTSTYHVFRASNVITSKMWSNAVNLRLISVWQPGFIFFERNLRRKFLQFCLDNIQKCSLLEEILTNWYIRTLSLSLSQNTHKHTLSPFHTAQTHTFRLHLQNLFGNVQGEAAAVWKWSIILSFSMEKTRNDFFCKYWEIKGNKSTKKPLNVFTVDIIVHFCNKISEVLFTKYLLLNSTNIATILIKWWNIPPSGDHNK